MKYLVNEAFQQKTVTFGQSKIEYLTYDDLEDINQGCNLRHCYEYTVSHNMFLYVV